MRSAPAPFGTEAIMKKFIYMCNEEHYVYILFTLITVPRTYEQNMNKL